MKLKGKLKLKLIIINKYFNLIDICIFRSSCFYEVV